MLTSHMSLLFLYFLKKQPLLYHKLIHYRNKLGCIEEHVRVNTSSKFNAIKEICESENCNDYQGSKYIPLIGIIHGCN